MKLHSKSARVLWRKSCGIGLVLAMSASVHAQTSTLVLPQAYANTEGESYTTYPFGRSTSVRDQFYYEPKLFTKSVSVTKLSFRIDGAIAFPAKQIEVSIELSTSPVKDASKLSDFFERNVGANRLMAFTKKKLSLPAVIATAGPRPFDLSFTLDKPFSYDPTKGGLLVDVRVHGQSPGKYALDLGARCVSNSGTFGAAGCKGSNNKVPSIDIPTATVKYGDQFVWRMRDMLPGGVGAVILGSKESGTWGPFTLPLSMQSFGAPGCSINTDILLLAPAVADGFGELRVTGAVPNMPELMGYWIKFQGLALDAKANALGIVTTQGAKKEICGRFPIGRVFNSNVNAWIGTVRVGENPVMELTFR